MFATQADPRIEQLIDERERRDRHRPASATLTLLALGLLATVMAVTYVSNHPIATSKSMLVGQIGLLLSLLVAGGFEYRQRCLRRRRAQTIRRHPSARPRRPKVEVNPHLARDTEAATLQTKLHDATVSLQRFASVASQDLRTPLRGISSLVEFLRSDLGPEVLPEVAHHLERIEVRVDRLNLVIDDLIRHTKAETRHETATETDLASLAHYLVVTVDLRSAISIELDIDLPPLMVTSTPLATCLRNLIDNAARHHHDPEHGHVLVSASMDNPLEVVVSVEDDGPGFEPAGWLTGADHPVADDGRGIGLHIVQRICLLHGAHLDIVSGPGQGTVCTLRWPARRSPAGGAGPATIHALDVGGPVIDLRDHVVNPGIASADGPQRSLPS